MNVDWIAAGLAQSEVVLRATKFGKSADLRIKIFLTEEGQVCN
jgi:hypothetical protein